MVHPRKPAETRSRSRRLTNGVRQTWRRVRSTDLSDHQTTPRPLRATRTASGNHRRTLGAETGDVQTHQQSPPTSLRTRGTVADLRVKQVKLRVEMMSRASRDVVEVMGDRSGETHRPREKSREPPDAAGSVRMRYGDVEVGPGGEVIHGQNEGVVHGNTDAGIDDEVGRVQRDTQVDKENVETRRVDRGGGCECEPTRAIDVASSRKTISAPQQTTKTHLNHPTSSTTRQTRIATRRDPERRARRKMK